MGNAACPLATMTQAYSDDDGAAAFYRRLLQMLRDDGFEFMVGGSYAFSQYTGIRRQTKDLDLFIRQGEWEHLAKLIGRTKWRCELSYPHWLGKIHHAEHFVDAIFNSGNGLSPVDDEWFVHAPEAQLLGHYVRLVPAEECVWTKAFIMERERFDGADVAHLLRACAAALNWRRLLKRFGPHWRVLLAHLVLVGFIYPDEPSLVPAWLMDELLARVHLESLRSGTEPRICAGTLLSREQYLPDLEQHGYIDARLLSHSTMTRADVAQWTDAIGPPAPA